MLCGAGADLDAPDRAAELLRAVVVVSHPGRDRRDTRRLPGGGRGRSPPQLAATLRTEGVHAAVDDLAEVLTAVRS
ncbi:hypothetical protein [Streptomyces sp. enrichment culture]|uniref:hypothetical protein n=1 Tax=Streptomyces sp. enrichment culture TaxID=1795815 RepID=UPI003F558736